MSNRDRYRDNGTEILDQKIEDIVAAGEEEDEDEDDDTPQQTQEVEEEEEDEDEDDEEEEEEDEEEDEDEEDDDDDDEDEGEDDDDGDDDDEDEDEDDKKKEKDSEKDSEAVQSPEGKASSTQTVETGEDVEMGEAEDDVDGAEPGSASKVGSDDTEAGEKAADEKEKAREAGNELANGAENGETASPAFSLREQLIYNARTAKNFDIVPYVLITYGSAIHSMALSRGPRWLFTGGEDGFIRKYDFIASIEGNLPLTVLQKHALVDTMSLLGVITSYWENEQPLHRHEVNRNITASQPNKRAKKSQASVMSTTHYEPQLSPVYSLLVQKDLLWLLSGLQSGGISLQTVRHNEGLIKHYFEHGPGPHQHHSAVDVLQLNHANDRFLSGSWDKKIIEWDLNTGSVAKTYLESTSQISSISFRPVGGMEITEQDYPQLEKSEDDEDDHMDLLFGDDDDDDADLEESLVHKMKAEIRLQQQGQLMTSELISDDRIFLSSSMDGSLNVWDSRIANTCALRIPVPVSTPPWCMSLCWSNDGDFIYAGRRNSTVEEFSIKMPFSKSRKSSIASKVLKFPTVSGPVSVVKPMLNGHHLLCGSYDNIRLYDLRLYDELKSNPKKLKIPFMIIPGHHGGVLSDIYVDSTCRFMVSASGNRGWNGSSTELGLIYEINVDS